MCIDIKNCNIYIYKNLYIKTDGDVPIKSGSRGGVQLVTDRKAGVSWLRVASATSGDQGNYTCAPLHVKPARVAIHVLQGRF